MPIPTEYPVSGGLAISASPTYRRMTSEEHRLIEHLVSAAPHSPGGFSDFMARVIPPVAGLLLGVIAGTLVQAAAGSWAGRWGILVGGLLGFMIGVRISWGRGESGADEKWRRYRRDLEGNKVEIRRFAVRGALKLDDPEGKRPSFFIDIGDGRILFLRGKYLGELERKGLFPSREIELVHAPESGLFFGIACLGRYFVPKRISSCTVDAGALPEDGEIFFGEIRAIEADLP